MALIKIKNNQTGEIKFVDQNDLPNYGIPLNNTTNITPLSSPLGGSSQPSSDILENAGQDVGNILTNLLSLPSNAIESGRQAAQDYRKTGNAAALMSASDPWQMLFRSVRGYAGNLNKDIGQPLQGGDIGGRAISNFTERPVSTILDVLPLTDFLKGATTANEVGLVSKTGKSLESIGGGLRQGVRQINQPASIYGAAKEAEINSTLDTLGIKGNAAQQYQQLAPNMAKLGDQILVSLESNPTNIKIDDVIDTFSRNIQDAGISTTKAGVKSAVTEFIGKVAPTSSDGSMSTEIGTDKLFALKKEANANYGVIQGKIMNGRSLTPTEQVQYVARKTLDDLVSQAHPEIKNLTKMQSNLYDAADSLAKSRNEIKTLPEILGTKIPLPSKLVGAGQDLLGETLQGAGKSVQEVSAPSGPTLKFLGPLGGVSTKPADNTEQGSSNSNQPVNNKQPNNNSTNKLDQIVSSISQSNKDQNIITPRELAYIQLLLPPTISERVKAAYDTQSDPAAIATRTAKTLDGLVNLYENMSPAQRVNPVDPYYTYLNSAKFSIAQNVERASLGRVSQTEIMNMMNNLFSPKTVINGRLARSQVQGIKQSLSDMTGQPIQ